ncbi:MAG TPA: hypothetical protein VN279_01290 [Rhodocyclaceae bacterium]|nr:hypothetical protein [Rhodocyclaceae bacterium]
MAQDSKGVQPGTTGESPERRGWRRREVLGALAGLGAGALLPGCVAAPAPPMPVAAGRAPKVGDAWTYRYTSGWANVKPQDLTVRVEEILPMAIRDRMSVATSSAVSALEHTSALAVRYRQVGGFAAVEFSPYLLAFHAIEPGMAFGGLGMPPVTWATEWRGTARVAGPETVSVPAGTFETIRVDVIGNRTYLGFMMDPRVDAVYMWVSAWFAPAARRFVRLTHRTQTLLDYPLDRDEIVLTSLSLK